MPPQSRLTDNAFNPADAHSCPACAHPVTGPCIVASPNIIVNGLQAMRVGDPGVHAACCGPNSWVAAMGSSTVYFNDLFAVRLGDMTTHCGGVGSMVMGSANVITGG